MARTLNDGMSLGVTFCLIRSKLVARFQSHTHTHTSSNLSKPHSYKIPKLTLWWIIFKPHEMLMITNDENNKVQASTYLITHEFIDSSFAVFCKSFRKKAIVKCRPPGHNDNPGY